MSEFKYQWFTLQTLTGQENKVEKYLLEEKRHNRQGIGDRIGEVLIPTEKVQQLRQVKVRDGKSKTSGYVDPTTVRYQTKKQIVTKKLYPGYVFVQAALYDAAGKVDGPVWLFIRGVQGVIGFVGGEPPAPMSQKDVDNLKATVENGSVEKVRPRVMFDPGDKIKIVDGPFMSFGGIVQEVDPDQGKLNVLVSIFGRDVPVELEYSQAERDDKPETPADESGAAAASAL